MLFQQILESITFVAYLAHVHGDIAAESGVVHGRQVVEEVVLLHVGFGAMGTRVVPLPAVGQVVLFEAPLFLKRLFAHLAYELLVAAQLSQVQIEGGHGGVHLLAVVALPLGRGTLALGLVRLQPALLEEFLPADVALELPGLVSSHVADQGWILGSRVVADSAAIKDRRTLLSQAMIHT